MIQYIIDEIDLKALLESNHRLRALKEGGVENWAWYSTSIDEYLDREAAFGFNQLAEEGLENFRVYRSTEIKEK